jgi:DNA-binding response OmpR family regulator
MSAGNELRRRVAVLDPMLRSREHMRRAIRALGHAPLVFNDLEELIPLRGKLLRCSALCVGLPPNPLDQQAWIRAARNLIAPEVPLLFIARENPLKAAETLRCTTGDLVLAAPSSFADVYKGMKAFLAQHALAVDDSGLEWGGYRFVPAKESVVLDGFEVCMRPLDFELALEFFHNIDRVLSRDWLRTMASGLAPETGGRWLDASVGRLRSQLGLIAFHGCEWKLSTIRYAGFKLSRSPGKKTSSLVSMSARDLAREASPALGA